jgi:hypothetical protein
MQGIAGSVSLPTLSAELYGSARRLRVFVAGGKEVPLEGILQVVRLDGDEVGERLRTGRALLKT